jgi:hypothetical protein
MLLSNPLKKFLKNVPKNVICKNVKYGNMHFFHFYSCSFGAFLKNFFNGLKSA